MSTKDSNKNKHFIDGEEERQELTKQAAGTKGCLARKNSSVKNAVPSVRVKKAKPLSNKNIRNNLIQTAVPTAKAKKRSLSSQSTVSTPKCKKSNNSVPNNAARNSSKTREDNFFPVTKLRSSSKISDIRKSLSSLENSIDRHNSRSNNSKAECSKGNQTVSKCGNNNNVEKDSSRESNDRKISKVTVKIKKSTAKKTGAEQKKKQPGKPKVKQSREGEKVIKTQDGRKKPPKKKVTYLITIHPINRNEENYSESEEVQLTTNTECPVESEQRDKSIDAYYSNATLRDIDLRMDIDSRIETIPATSSSNNLTDYSSNVVQERPDSEANTESQAKTEIQIESETLHSNPENNSPKISSMDTETQTQVNPKNASFSLPEIKKSPTAADINNEQAKPLSINTQKESPRTMNSTGGTGTSSSETEESSTGQKSTQVIETPRPLQIQNMESRIRTRCIKPKELNRRTPSQTAGLSWYRSLYRVLYGTDENE